MRIGIDARLIEETGVGRYIRNLLSALAEEDTKTTYCVFLRDKSYRSFALPNKRWEKYRAEVAWHSVAEQIVMPRLLRSASLDLVHIPYHNPPVFYGGPMVVTIHDLTILHVNTGKATTLPVPVYQLKRLGYWAELAIGLRRAKAVIAVSQATKREIMDHFRLPEDKIAVTYEGVDAHITEAVPVGKRLVPGAYALYVGNAYPHKNLETLIGGYRRFLDRSRGSNLKLVLVGYDDPFYRRLRRHIRREGLDQRVVLFGQANDRQLSRLYRDAAAFVFPSRMEGFGLPALEALSMGCPVYASDIPIFHEVLGDHATYFDSDSEEHIAHMFEEVSHLPIRPAQIPERDLKFVQSYSWRHMAKETRAIYERCVGV